jgi:capsular polysaccharide biosynthesis protein
MLNTRRRGSVIIMAVAILALLFMVGSTLLVVSNQGRLAAQEAVKARDLRAISETMTQGVMMQLRDDVTGVGR